MAEIHGIPPGQQLVIVQHIGYAPEQVLIDFAPGAQVEAEFPLRLAPVMLGGLTATGERRNPRLDRMGFYNRQKLGFGSFLTEEEIEKRRPTASGVADFLRGVGGLSIQSAPMGGAVIYSRRGASVAGPCRIPVYLDGVRITPRTEQARRMSPGADDINKLVTTHDVAAIEVYRGGSDAPIQYRECGAILIWTRVGQ